MAETVVFQFPNHGFGPVRLVRLDVTDPTTNHRFPYALTRAGASVARVELTQLNRQDLEWLRDAIDRELSR